MPYRTLARKPIGRIVPFRVEVSLDQDTTDVDEQDIEEYIVNQLTSNRQFGCSVAVRKIEKEKEIGGSAPNILSELLGISPQDLEEINHQAYETDQYAEIAKAYFDGDDQGQKERHVIHLLSVLLREVQ